MPFLLQNKLNIMIEFKIYNNKDLITSQEKEELVEFLYQHLEQFGDEKEDIEKSFGFALCETNAKYQVTPLGGFILEAIVDNITVGVVVINRTGMKGYIPENILVYIATHKDYRGKGIGKALMQKTIEMADGNIALHVEEDNPARFLYEKVGFEKKYLEMRYVKK